MDCHVHRCFRWLLLLSLLSPAKVVYAQSPACSQKPAAEIDFSQDVKITILKVEFPRDFPLSEDIRTKIEHEIRSRNINTDPISPDSERWVENMVDWRIREELQRLGYFKANVHSRPHLVLAKTGELQYIVEVEAEAGSQYRLRKLQFKNASPDMGALNVGEDELRRLLPLHSGDIFDVSKIRLGLEAIGSQYGQLGFIDALPVPDTYVDEQNHQIDLVVNIDEQRQYRVAMFKVVGLDSQVAKPLESLIEAGQVFNKTSFEALFKEHQSALPFNSSIERNARISRNVRDGTVDIVLDFRPCPQR